MEEYALLIMTPLLLTCLSLALLAPLSARTWTSSDGVALEADYVSSTGTEVTIKRDKDGKTFTLKLTRLSEEDREFVELEGLQLHRDRRWRPRHHRPGRQRRETPRVDVCAETREPPRPRREPPAAGPGPSTPTASARHWPRRLRPPGAHRSPDWRIAPVPPARRPADGAALLPPAPS